MRKQQPYLLAIVTALLVLTTDLFSKQFASRLGWVSLNTGISFGLFEQHREVVALAILAAFLGLAAVVLRRYIQSHPMETGLFIGGALGNLCDRFVYGGVRDWIPLIVVPIKNNVADWAIFIAVVSIVLSQVRQQSEA